jgi:hypothetical protein
MTILGVDVSHYQGSINWIKVWQSGRTFGIIKATEGTSFTDPMFNLNRMNAHAAGLIVGFYHFARGGDPIAEANYFLSRILPLQQGEFLVLDWEINAGNPAGWCKSWLNYVYAATGVRPLIYMNGSRLNSIDWSGVTDYGLWYAKPDSRHSQPPSGVFPFTAMKQFIDPNVTPNNVPGIGQCDEDIFFGDKEALLSYGFGGDMANSDEILSVVNEVRRMVGEMVGYRGNGQPGNDTEVLGLARLDNTPVLNAINNLNNLLVDLPRQIAEGVTNGINNAITGGQNV